MCASSRLVRVRSIGLDLDPGSGPQPKNAKRLRTEAQRKPAWLVVHLWMGKWEAGIGQCPPPPPPGVPDMSARSLLRLVICLWIGGSFSVLPEAQATVLKATPGLPGDVWVYSTPGGTASRPQELQGIVLLPVDAVGRSPFLQFLPEQPRLKADVPFTTRILLPQNQGSLYRYRKSDVSGTRFGYFVVRPNGTARFLAAFPGTGPGGADDPIPDPVAVTSDGSALLVSTTPDAG